MVRAQRHLYGKVVAAHLLESFGESTTDIASRLCSAGGIFEREDEDVFWAKLERDLDRARFAPEVREGLVSLYHADNDFLTLLKRVDRYNAGFDIDLYVDVLTREGAAYHGSDPQVVKAYLDFLFIEGYGKIPSSVEDILRNVDEDFLYS